MLQKNRSFNKGTHAISTKTTLVIHKISQTPHTKTSTWRPLITSRPHPPSKQGCYQVNILPHCPTVSDIITTNPMLALVCIDFQHPITQKESTFYPVIMPKIHKIHTYSPFHRKQNSQWWQSRTTDCGIQ